MEIAWVLTVIVCIISVFCTIAGTIMLYDAAMKKQLEQIEKKIKKLKK